MKGLTLVDFRSLRWSFTDDHLRKMAEYCAELTDAVKELQHQVLKLQKDLAELQPKAEAVVEVDERKGVMI
jgi:hypothetical protein